MNRLSGPTWTPPVPWAISSDAARMPHEPTPCAAILRPSSRTMAQDRV
ncbi:hypothetical protein AB0K16_50780 [Nonomuraea jabiensis]